MAAITSAQTGNWSSASTWTGGVIPGNGDTITIQSGHSVTVDSDRIIGTSPAAGTGTAAVKINATNGALAIAAGVKLTVRGDIFYDGQLSLSAGAKLWFDPTQAASPTTAAYIARPTSNDAPGLGATVSAIGTAGARCEIKT